MSVITIIIITKALVTSLNYSARQDIMMIEQLKLFLTLSLKIQEG